MKNEDILKTIAILSGYDRNITFDKWRLEDSPGEWCYEMTAENDKEEFISICEPGLAMAIVLVKLQNIFLMITGVKNSLNVRNELMKKIKNILEKPNQLLIGGKKIILVQNVR